MWYALKKLLLFFWQLCSKMWRQMDFQHHYLWVRFGPLSVLGTLLPLSTWQAVVAKLSGNMYCNHEDVKQREDCALCSVLVTGKILTSIVWAGWWETAEWVATKGKCGSRHTVISLSISTLGFNYFADDHTIPSLRSLFTTNPDNSGSYSNVGTETFFFFVKGHQDRKKWCSSDAMDSDE